MAVITFNKKDNSITILVEKTDAVSTVGKNQTIIEMAKSYNIGKVFINGPVDKLCMIRGER